MKPCIILLFTLFAPLLQAQNTLDADTNNIDRVVGETWWFDNDNSGNSMGVTNINGSATPNAPLPGWAWTQSGFMIASNGVVREVGAADVITNHLATLPGDILDQSQVTIVTNDLAVGYIMTRADLQVNNGSTLTLDQGGLLFSGGSHQVRSSSGGGFLTSTYDAGSGVNELFLIGASTATGGGQNLHQVRLVMQDNGAKPTRVITDGFAPLLTGQMVFAAANTYTGGTIINRVRGQGGNLRAYGTGTVTVPDNNGQAWLTAGGGSFANDFHVAGKGWLEGSGLLGAIRFGSNTRISGKVILTGDARLCPWEGNATGWVYGDVSGPYVLEKWGNGRLILAGSTDVGEVQVPLGTLQIGEAGAPASLKATNLTVNAARNLYGFGTIDAEVTLDGNLAPGTVGQVGHLDVEKLILNTGSTLQFDIINSTPDTINVTTLEQFSVSALDVSLSGLVTNGRYRLITYDDSISTLSGFTLTTNGVTRKTLTLDTFGVFGEVHLVVSGPDGNLTWRPTEPSNTWDLDISTNWWDGAAPSTFLDNDLVLFDDSGATTNDVNLVGALSPVLTTVHSSSNYTFAGGGSLTGLGSLIKDGEGTLTMNNNNSFSGEVVVTNGILHANHNNALGAKSEGVTIYPDGTLDLSAAAGNTRDLGAEVISIVGDGFNGQGAIINSGVAQQSATERVTLLGDASIGGSARWDIRGPAGGTILSTGGNPYNFTKLGGHQFSLVSCEVDPALNDIHVLGGTFAYEVGTTGLGNPAAEIVITNNATFMMWRATNPPDKHFVMSDGTRIFSRAAANTIVGPIELVNGAVTMDLEQNLTLAGSVSGSGGILKEDAPTLYLTGDNSYSGGTVVLAGQLWVGNNTPTGSLGTGPVEMNANVLRVQKTAPVSIPGAVTGSNIIQLFGTDEVTMSDVVLTNAANNASIRMGFNGGGTPTLVVPEGGSILANWLFLGENPNFAANIRQEGGLLRVDSNTDGEGPLRIGHWSNEISTYDLIDGHLEVPQGRVSLGIDGHGVWNISGGTATVNRVEVNGRNDRGNGTLNLSGGELAIGAGGIVNEGNPYTVNFSGGTLRAQVDTMSILNTTLANMTEIATGPNLLTISGNLMGAGGLSKVDSGILLLSGANTFTGPLQASAGTLRQNGSHTGASTIQVDAGATLGGIGSSDAQVVVDGTLAAGESVGSLTLNGDVDLNGTLEVEVDTGGNDLVADINVLNLGAASVLNVAGMLTETNYVVMTAATINGTFADVSSVTDQGYQVVYDSGEVRLTPDLPDIVAEIKQVGGQVELSWDAEAGVSYDLVFKLDLQDPTWEPVPGFTNLTGTGSTTVTNALPGEVRGYLRISRE